MQIAAYMAAAQEMGIKHPINKIGVLHLKAATRGRDKTGNVMQGEGWKLIECDFEHHYNLFLATLRIHREEYPDQKPKNRVYPAKIKI